MKENGLRQKDVAQKIGISEAQLSLMLREERSTTQEVAFQLASKFGGTVEQYVWNIGHQSLPKGLVTGDGLLKLCADGGIISGHTPNGVALSLVNLRIGRLVTLFDREGGEPKESIEIDHAPLLLRSGNAIQISILEELKVPSDISATVQLSLARVYQGFVAPSFTMPPNSPTFPPIIIQYWAARPTELSAGDLFFTVSFIKL